MVKFLTLNLRHNVDRWEERFPLVVEAIHQEQPDIIAFQEVHIEINQAQIIAEALEQLTTNKPYNVHVSSRMYEGRWESNALLSRLPVLSAERIELPMDGGRSGQRIAVRVDDTQTLNIANVHLHHQPMLDDVNRLPQMQALLQWMFAHNADHWLLAGDMNALPDSATITEALKHLNNAYYDLNNTHPITFPTPLTEGKYGDIAVTLDYIFYTKSSLKPLSAKRIADQHGGDEALYPSDHYGLVAEFEFQANQ